MTRYDIVPGASRVSVDASSSVHPIHVEATELSGFLDLEIADDGELEPAGDPIGQVQVKVEDLKSGNRLIDKETDRRVDTRKHPNVVGELTSLESVGNGRYRASGEIKFHGVTHAVEGEMRIELDDDGKLVLTGQQTFDVRNWDLQPPKLLMLKVDPEVEVEIEVHAEASD